MYYFNILCTQMYEMRFFLIDISSACSNFLLIRVHAIYHFPLSSVMITIRRSITIFLEESPSQPHLTRGRAYLLEAVTMWPPPSTRLVLPAPGKDFSASTSKSSAAEEKLKELTSKVDYFTILVTLLSFAFIPMTL